MPVCQEGTLAVLGVGRGEQGALMLLEEGPGEIPAVCPPYPLIPVESLLDLSTPRSPLLSCQAAWFQHPQLHPRAPCLNP